MFDRYTWRYFDWPLLAVVVVLCAIGISMIYSATINTIDLYNTWYRQLLWFAIGITALFVIAIFDYRQLEILAVPAFIVFVISLVLVTLFGETRGGSQRWLFVGVTEIQPTELGKFVLVLFMAWYLSRFQDRLHRLPYLLAALVFLLAPLVLVYTQPDLGMTITMIFIGGTLILAAGVRLWQVGMIAAAGIAALPLLWGTLSGYMLDRIEVFLNPNSSQADSFNVRQALIAVGNGGWLGEGWTQGTQNQLHFLRVRHTDFIFSVLAEEIGLIGTVFVLGLFVFVIWRLLRIADMAQDQFGRLLAMGVATIVFFQFFINVAMNMSLMPVTGLTLPFVSYGGSSLVTMMAAIGLAQSVAMRHRKMEFA